MLLGSLPAAGCGAGGWPAPEPDGAVSLDGFMRLSGFLIPNHRLDAELGKALYQAYPPGSDANRRLAALDRTIHRLAVAGPEALVAADDEDGVANAAIGLVRAWYLGRVGDGSQVALVAYEDALMFAPTRDVTPVPTFCSGEFGYWASVPPGAGLLPRDDSPPGTQG
jgi:hypothetical protein